MNYCQSGDVDDIGDYSGDDRDDGNQLSLGESCSTREANLWR